MAQRTGDEREPMLVRCKMKVPKRKARQVGELGLAFGCGGATAKPTRQGDVDIEAVVEIEKVAEIVGKGIPVLVTERIAIEPVPADEITRDVDAWIAEVTKPVGRRRRR
jgi:hypothetical protein